MDTIINNVVVGVIDGGVRGPEGLDGTDGLNGWSPLLAVITDGARRVLQVIDWTGGTTTKPTTGLYVGVAGLTAVLASAIDIRAYGANNTSLDGLTLAADKGLYSTGAATLALYTLTSFARGVLAGVDAAAFRTSLVLVPGTDVLAISGGTLTGNLVLNADPATALGAATKQYVDNLASGLQVKNPVLLATTANITRSGEQTIDGVLTSASRILVKDQTAPAENGVFTTAAGAWTRATDLDVWTEFPAANLWVETGTANADTAWVCTVDLGGTLNTTAVTWVKFGGSGAFQAAHANLTAFSGLSLVADRLPYANGAGTLALATFTAAGRALVDDADAAAQRATLGLATAALVATGTSGATIGLLNGNNTYSGTVGLGADFSITGVITATALSADANNYAPTGFSTATVVNISASGAIRNITGLAGGVDGKVVFLFNNDVAGYAINLLSENASSTAANRVSFIASYTLYPGNAVILKYEGSSSRWKPLMLPLQASASLNDVPNTTTARIALAVNYLEATQTYDPASIANGAVGATQTVTVTGAALGGLVTLSFSLDMQGMDYKAWVSAANTVKYAFVNNSGGTLDLASGTVRVRVWT